jgi:NADH-quinone oxidoreductase subunit L
MELIIKLIALLPLLAAIFVGLRTLNISRSASQVITSGAVILSALFSWIIFFKVNYGDESYLVELFRWFAIGDFQASWELRVDGLTALMLTLITTVSSIVHLYSIGYMSHDTHPQRFMAYLSLFTFFMIMLVTSNNLLQLFLGWEGVGLASYLLIGFWYKRESANKAAMKAFLVNRVGDLGLALGLFTCFYVFGTISYDEIFSSAPLKVNQTIEFLGVNYNAIDLICVLLFIGAMGKSAQLGLHTWLPDAMEGPTPVSALIHAATMVTAGIFLVARMSPMFELSEIALSMVTIVGALTAIFAATIALTQNDIKKVIAYSTCSQLGYMFFACGISAYAAGMFHLYTHGFFKALLFLGAGSVIHAMSDEQDMRNMGGLWKKIPVTYIYMIIGTLAITGFPFLSGFYSKDLVLEAAYAAGEQGKSFGMLAFWLGITAALLTAFYSWRLIFMTFHGKSRASKEVQDHVHESPKIMTMPLVVLAVGAVFMGFSLKSSIVPSVENINKGDTFWSGSIAVEKIYVGNSNIKQADIKEVDEVGKIIANKDEVSENSESSEDQKLANSSDKASDENIAGNDDRQVFTNIYELAHEVPKWVILAPMVVGVLGFILALIMYIIAPSAPKKIAEIFRPVYNLSHNKWYFDELYDAIFVKPALAIGRFFWKIIDVKSIDNFGPNGFALVSVKISALFKSIQSGFVYHYSSLMLLGLILALGYFVFM